MADQSDYRTSVRQKKDISKGTFIWTLLIVVIISFIAGSRSNELISNLTGQKLSGSLDLSSVQDTYKELKSQYDGSLDVQKLIDGANRGMVAAAGDPYTVYMDKEESDAFKKDLSGDIGGGIGAEIGIRSGQPTVVRVLENNPAARVGLKAGDVIVGINDVSTKDWALDKTVSKIRGEEGSSVKVTVSRSQEIKTFSIVREKVNNPSVQASIVDGIGVLKLSRFDDQTGDLSRRAAEDFKSKGVRGVILDLRDNGGGYVTAAQDIAGIWLNDKPIITERKDNKIVETINSVGSPILDSTPTVILINGGSASASEIVAGALKEYSKASLIGEKSFGKGTVQKIDELSNGRILKVTVARWFTPNGKNITKEGISPDIEVKLTADDADKGLDPQQAAAIKNLLG